jgi:hypothetical protein
MKEKVLSLYNENINRTLLPPLSKYKCKEKWEKTIREAKLFVQKLWTLVYRRSCAQLQRLSFILDKAHIIDDGSRS